MDLVPAGGVLRDRIFGKVRLKKSSPARMKTMRSVRPICEAEDLGIEFFRAIQVFHRDREVQNTFDFRHGRPIRAKFGAGARLRTATRNDDNTDKGAGLSRWPSRAGTRAHFRLLRRLQIALARRKSRS